MSITLNPTSPADADSPRQGAAAIRALTLQLLELINQGGGGSVTIANVPMTISTAGQVTILQALFVPSPTAAGHAVNLSYMKSWAAPAPVQTTTIVSSSISAGGSGTIFTLASTPPVTPANTALYRAAISSVVFAQSPPSTGGSTLVTKLTDSASLFTTLPASGIILGRTSISYVSSNLIGISNATRSQSQGAVTFTVTGFASADGITNIKAASDLDSNSKSFLAVTWIPAQ